MRSACPVLMIFLAGFGVGACSSVEDEPVHQRSESGRIANTAPGMAENKAAPSNRTATANETISTEPAGNISKRKVGPPRTEGENARPSNIDLEKEIAKSMRPAAENSEFGAVLTDVLFERRIFNRHPLLLKVEKTTKGQEKTIKVYLKDGRSIDISGDKIQFVSTVSSADILKAAGIDVPEASREPHSKTLQ